MEPSSTSTPNKHILFKRMEDNIGQVKESEAQVEIDRLNKQTGRVWRRDYTEYLEDDDQFRNGPSKLSDGYCWIVTDCNDEL